MSCWLPKRSATLGGPNDSGESQFLGVSQPQSVFSLAVRTAATTAVAGTGHPSWHGANAWTRPGRGRVVSAEHTDAGAELGSAERDHVLTDMGGNDLAMLGRGVRQNVLNEVVAVLVAGNVNQGDPRPVDAPFADAVQIAAQELGPADFQTLLDNLGGELIHAVLRSIADDMVNSTASVRGSTVLADVLDAPVAELAMSDNVNVGQHLLYAGTLRLTCQQP